MTLTRRDFTVLAASSLATIASSSTFAQTYPSRLVTIVVGGAAGGGVDALGRLLADKLVARLGQHVIVENKPGASAALAASFVARAEADGYTLLLTGSSPLVVRPHLVKEMAYDPIRDLAPVTRIAEVPLVLVTTPKIPARTIEELVGYLKEQGSKVNYASNGVGGGYHLVAEHFKSLTGARMNHIPYNGGDGVMLRSLLGGETQLAFIQLFTTFPQIKAGAIRALGVTTAGPVASAPEIPPISASVPGFEMVPWYGLFLPPKTRAEIVIRLNSETNAILKDPEFKQRMEALGNMMLGSTPEELAALVKSDLQIYGEIVKSAKIQL